MMLAAMLAMVLAAAAPALAQDDEEGGDQSNLAGVDCDQVLQQIGGNQYATATGSGEGDTAAANNQEFSADQEQQCLAIAGEGNAAAQNTGDITGEVGVDDDGDGETDEKDGSEGNGGTGGENGDGNNGAVAIIGVVGVDDDGDGAVDEKDGSEEEAVAVIGVVGADDDGDGATDEDDGTEAVVVVEGASGGDDMGATLPDTGGYSLIALGAGALLVAGGLVARRIVR